MSASGTSVVMQPRGGRTLDIASALGVAVILVYTVLNLVMLLGGFGQRTTSSSGVGVASGIVFAVILAAYLMVVMRAPNGPRWAYFGFLAVVLGVSFATALNMSSDAQAGQQTSNAGGTSIGGFLVVSAMICGPLLYMRLRLPRIKTKALQS